MKTFKKLMIVTAAVFGAPLPFLHSASAQGWTGPPVLVPQPLVDVVDLHRNAERTASKVNSGGSKDDRATQPRPTTTNPALLRFTPDLALRKSVTAQFAATLGREDAVAGRYVASGVALGDMQRRMTALGLAPNNVGDSVAFFIASHWSLARGNAALPARPTMQAFKAQLAGMLAGQQGAAQMPNAAKQQQAESMQLLTGVSMRAMENAQGNPAAARAIAASAGQMLKGMGFDPAAFNLTAEGLVAVK